jgi:hypothetical protein
MLRWSIRSWGSGERDMNSASESHSQKSILYDDSHRARRRMRDQSESTVCAAAIARSILGGGSTSKHRRSLGMRVGHTEALSRATQRRAVNRRNPCTADLR